MDCSCAGNATITDHRPSKTRVALGLQGDNSPPFPPSALTPAATFITGRENIVSCPLTNTCQFQEKELFFLRRGRKIKCFSDPQKREWEEKIRQSSPLSTVFFLSFCLFFLKLHLLFLLGLTFFFCLSPSVSLWPLGAALPLI